jgi:threonine dehydrogenase-like Zn-dependent dehydrogenase
MRALVIDPRHGLALHDVAAPSLARECLIRVTTAGICGTDVHLLAGYAGFSGVPGHEFVGVVEHAPAEDAHWVGKRVVGEINVGCGLCAWCAGGGKEHCPSRTVVGIRGRGGAFAEYLTLPATNLHAVPDAIDDDAAVFVEPVAAACRILEQVDVHTGSRIAVLGDGRLGILVAQVLQTRSANVTLFGRHSHKLNIARDLDIETRTDASGERYEIVVDATGRRDGLTHAIELVAPRGTIVLKSTFHGEAGTPLWPVVVHEVTIVGSRCGPFARAIDLIVSGRVRTHPLVSHRFALEEYANAFLAAREHLKVLFRCH